MDNKIRNKDHYFNKWLKYRRIDERITNKEISEYEISLDAMHETQNSQSELYINKNNEIYDLVELENSEFEWIEHFKNESLYKSVKYLSKSEKKLLTMRIREQMSHDEIADILKISSHAVEGRFWRIMKKLKNYQQI